MQLQFTCSGKGGPFNRVCGNKKMFGGPTKSGLPSTTGKSGLHKKRISYHSYGKAYNQPFFQGLPLSIK